MKWTRRQSGAKAEDPGQVLGYKETIAALKRLVGQRVGTELTDVATGKQVAWIGIGYVEDPADFGDETCFMIDEVKNPRPDRDGLLDYLNVPHLRGLKSWDHGDKVVFTYGGVRVTVTK
jgi:hypothetical protein